MERETHGGAHVRQIVAFSKSVFLVVDMAEQDNTRGLKWNFGRSVRVDCLLNNFGSRARVAGVITATLPGRARRLSAKGGKTADFAHFLVFLGTAIVWLCLLRSQMSRTACRADRASLINPNRFHRLFDSEAERGTESGTDPAPAVDDADIESLRLEPLAGLIATAMS